MMIITCDGCRQRIDEADADAAVRLLLGGERVDWCGGCVAVIRAELPRLAAQAREAQRLAAAEPVRSRALRLWEGRDLRYRDAPDPKSGQRILTP